MTDLSPDMVAGDERATLTTFLDYLRECAAAKLTGADELGAAAAMVPSGTSLLWLALHLTAIEVSLVQRVLAGRRGHEVVPGRPPAIEDDTVAAALDRYRAACAESRVIVEACADLGQRSIGRYHDGSQPTARWIVLHLLEETARHCGHIDILREQLDGRTGR